MPSFPGRTKILSRFLVLFGLVLFIPAFSRAQVTLVSLTVSNNNPTPGSVVAVTVVYCDTANRTPFWLVALNPSSTNIQSCPTANQALLVDGGTTPTGVNNVTSNQDDASDPGGNGWGGVAVPNSPPPCNYTQVFNVTIPNNLNAGPYNLIVKANDYFVQCTSGGVELSTPITLPYPPANVSLTESADGSTANPGDLILFHIDYSYGNTGPVTITTTIPANVTLAGGTGNISPGGTLAGSTITWVLPASLPSVNGEVWFLTRVNGGVPTGTVITNAATAASANAGPANAQAQVNVGTGGFQLIKSQSSPSVNLGSTVTYTLDYQVSGMSLQSSDNYDNNIVGTANGAVVGYDGTGYTYTNTGGTGGYTVQTDGVGNHYLQGCALNTCNTNATGGNFPTLLRNGPAINLCGNFMVQGDMQIPPGSAAGADASMILAQNLAAGGVYDAYVIGISLDNGPGNFFLQRNQSPGSVTFPAALPNASIGTVITAGVWYTVKVLVTFVGGALQFQAKVWPQGTQEPAAWSLTYTDNTPLPCTAINGGSYEMGWQADGTSSTDYYTNLKLYGPSPVVNPRLWDTLPAGLNFVASQPAAPTSQNGNYLEWDLGGARPATTYNVTGAITLTAAVTACGAPAVNVGDIMGDAGASMVTSNAVTLTVIGCGTNTPTSTPTDSPTPTPTNSPTVTPTATISSTATNSPTVTPTSSPTNSPTITPSSTPTSTPTSTSTAGPITLLDTVSQNIAEPGDLLTYNVKFESLQGGSYNNLTLFVTLPPNVTLISVNPNSGPVYNAATRTLTWVLPGNPAVNVSPGYTVGFSYQARVDANAPTGAVQTDQFSVTYTGQAAPVTVNAPVTVVAHQDVFYIDHNLFSPANDGAVSILVDYSRFPGDYSLRIYNTAGEHIKTLDTQTMTGPLSKTYTWDGKNKNGDACASGMYIFYLVEPFDRKVKRLILIR